MKIVDPKLYCVLDSQSFKKIFPEEYFQKFASHLKVLQFEKNLFASPPEPGKLKFTARPKGLSAQKPKSIPPKTILTKFARVPDTIQNDRQQIIRFKQINKQIAQSMQNPENQLKAHKEHHPNEIKKISNQEEINTKIIDEMMIESTRETKQSIQEKLQSLKKKAVYCNFTKRDAEVQGKNSCKMKLQWSSMRRYNSEKKMNSISNNFESTFSKKLLEHSIQQKMQQAKEQESITKMNNFQLKLPKQLINEAEPRSRSNSLRVKDNMGSSGKIRSSKKLIKNDEDLKTSVKKNLVDETRKLIEKKHLLKSFLYTQDVIHQSTKQNLAKIIADSLATAN